MAQSQVCPSHCANPELANPSSSSAGDMGGAAALLLVQLLVTGGVGVFWVCFFLIHCLASRNSAAASFLVIENTCQ